ncbi:trimethylamine methyltransferase family protein [bacterium]|nr:trimethylamine methyltransferase family protein [candidate division CSSED10-310 bacterium]
MNNINPQIYLLTEDDIHRIIDDAWEVLETVGVEADHENVLRKAADHGFRMDKASMRLYFDRKKSESIIQNVPASFKLYDRDGLNALTIGNDNVYFDPGSAAVFWLEPGLTTIRRATSRDCIELAILTDLLPGYRIQSTGVVPSDVPEDIADSIRLLFALSFCTKPVITGTFNVNSFAIMKSMLESVAGGSEALKNRPLAVFDCCPSPPLRWSHLTVSALVDCAVSGIPAEMVSMPLAGATAPVTLWGSLVQHTAECLSGAIIHQMFGPGSPIVWGGSPAAFDMRHGTPPMGSMETMMIDLAYAQIGRYLGFPTHAYMACSDAKTPDYQAGMESGIGAVLAVLGRINIVSGPGFLNYENTQSPEKLIMDHDACALAYRLKKGIIQRPDDHPVDIICRHAIDGQFLADQTTRRWHRDEIDPPGSTIYRKSMDDWLRDDRPDARQLARKKLETLKNQPHSRLEENRLQSLTACLMEACKNKIYSDSIKLHLERYLK